MSNSLTSTIIASLPSEQWLGPPIIRWLDSLPPHFQSEKLRPLCVEYAILGTSGLNGMKRRIFKAFQEYNEKLKVMGARERKIHLLWREFWQRVSKEEDWLRYRLRRGSGEATSEDNGEELD